MFKIRNQINLDIRGSLISSKRIVAFNGVVFRRGTLKYGLGVF